MIRLAVFSQIIGGGFQWTMGNVAIAIIVILAVVAVVVLFMRETGLQPPPWVWKLITIIVAAAVCILAIRFLLSL